MSIKVSRRNFLKLSTAGVATSSMALLGFAPEPALASIRYYKLAAAKVTRNTCTYCSVGCGMLLYSRGDGGINTVSDIYHVEGDPDHPVSRGSLCPKGAGVLDFIKSESRLSHPEVREPGSNEWKRISWNEALDRIARYMKEDRDKNFVTHDADGHLVNHWTTTGFLAASACSNETAYLTQKVIRSLGMLAIDNQARV
ncbi:sulfate ABC transporter substrate-binding protein [Pseudomonas oryzihabitans]|jgi:formate dehydrogenase major subunit|uniref:Anaerobic selenocysteine-containing dehydrogenase n=1 Tax=Pseudomonas oryzihabitans TaxID=47885 RepID=A0AAJ2BMF3_9PSED|nr:sulfate ABC transporter substrate-binding protein [Pseudomonas psychrotolerans]KTT32824.1 sulfate ABC transporter substrate-binding protein [Pseudomonas psychrotolerans]KTT38114.1 sulfate ABC transporter substrate-binding protein [Pseudomonas psychrotolerans]KTT43602.1 sulfate ABC transporter substrate-binding protein [Pseudomonas psychrotolerans]KTT67401.1 sulfate ABC transporter substrate-binding protein [Pseudomonas psychrotolerans]